MPPSRVRIHIVTEDCPELVDDARTLFVEYHEWLGEVVCSERLSEEIASLPGPYAPPEGRLLLASYPSDDPVGVIGVRPFESGVCEMKRLYVRPGARGSGLGRLLVEHALEAAREIGYREVRLTTLPETMGLALALYREFGFEEAEPFTDHSHVQDAAPMLYMSRSL